MKWTNLYLVWPREKERRFKILDRVTNEREDLTTDFTEIRRITKERYGQLYSHKVDSCHEMDRYLKRHKLLKLTQKKKTI